MKNVQRIVVPTDGSEHADVALEAAIDLAKLLKKPLHAIYVIDHPSFQAFPPESLLVDVTKLVRKEADAVLQRIQERAKKAKAKATTEVREGHPAEEIVRAATAKDLIVISTHGRRGISRMLLGSVAEAVVRSAPCPVLVIRHRRSK
jgi:nucleotide-binding universal stress UspA family protein